MAATVEPAKTESGLDDERRTWGNSVIYPRNAVHDATTFDSVMETFENTTIAAITKAGYEVIPDEEWASKANPVYSWEEEDESGEKSFFGGSAEEFEASMHRSPTDEECVYIWHEFRIPVRPVTPPAPEATLTNTAVKHGR